MENAAKLRARFRGTAHQDVATATLAIIAQFHGAWDDGFDILRWEGGRAILAPRPRSGPPQRRTRHLSPTAISWPRYLPARAPDGLYHLHCKHENIVKSGPGEQVASLRYARYQEAHGRTDGLIDSASRATREAEYIEGHASVHAERVVDRVSNVPGGYAPWIDLVRRLEAYETWGGQDTITIDRGPAHAPLWKKVLADHKLPEALALALLATPDGATATHEVADARAIANWLEKREYIPEKERSKRRPGKSKREPHPGAAANPFAMKAHKKGRVLSTIVCALPHELSFAGKQRCLRRIHDIVASRGLPATAVMHAPCAANDPRNWHLHLAYSSRPVALMPDGRYDFETQVWERRPNGRKKLVRKDQRRHPDCEAYGWVRQVRTECCRIVNEELEREGRRPRFTILSNQERGLAHASSYRGSRRSAALRDGQMSRKDLAENLASWQHREMEEVAEALVPLAPLEARAHGLRFQGDRKLAPHEHVAFSGLLDIFWQEIGQIADQRATAAKSRVARAQIASGPSALIADQHRLLRVLNKQSPTPARLRKRNVANVLIAEAAALRRSYAAPIETLVRNEQELEQLVQAGQVRVTKGLDELEALFSRPPAKAMTLQSARSAAEDVRKATSASALAPRVEAKPLQEIWEWAAEANAVLPQEWPQAGATAGPQPVAAPQTAAVPQGSPQGVPQSKLHAYLDAVSDGQPQGRVDVLALAAMRDASCRAPIAEFSASIREELVRAADRQHRKNELNDAQQDQGRA